MSTSLGYRRTRSKVQRIYHHSKEDKAAIKAIQAAIEEAKEQDKGKWNRKIPATHKCLSVMVMRIGQMTQL